jgi:hypothetical protein
VGVRVWLEVRVRGCRRCGVAGAGRAVARGAAKGAGGGWGAGGELVQVQAQGMLSVGKHWASQAGRHSKPSDHSTTWKCISACMQASKMCTSLMAVTPKGR